MKKLIYVVLALSLFVSACDCVENTKPQYEAESQLPLDASSLVVLSDFNPDEEPRNSDQFFSRTMVRT